MAELAPGVVVAGCRIEAVVGRGGMGVVYRATQLSLNRRVALKVIAPELTSDVTFRERFKRESQIAASIEHPNVIPVYEAGERDGLLYLTLRYVEGTDLRALIASSRGGLDPARAARIVGQTASALAAAHRRGLVHRDVKPANVLIAAGDDHAYLTDFGIARHVAATGGLTRTGAVVGTIDYLAPERIRDASSDASADVYGLGCVLFESLTGSVPYPRDNDVAKMYAHLNAPTPVVADSRPEVPGVLSELAERAMAKDPADRIESAGELAALLLEAAPARPPSAIAVAPPPDETRTAISQPPPGEAAPTDARTPTAPFPSAAATTAPSAPAPAAQTPASDPPTAGATAVGPPASPTAAGAPAATGPRRRSARPPLIAVVGGIAAAVAGIAVLIALLLGGEEEGGPAVVNVGRGADGVAVGLGYVWVANRREHEVVRVDPDTGERKAVAVGREPDSLAVDRARRLVWVTNTGSGSVSRITAAGEVEGREIAVGAAPEGIMVAAGAVWVANGGDGTVTRLDGRLRARTVDVGPGPVQLARAGDRVWVTLAEGRKVVPLDAATGARDGRPVELDGARLRGITYGSDRLWVAASDRNRVYRFDPDQPRNHDYVVVEADPRELRYGAGGVWISHGERGVVSSIDPRTLNKGAAVAVGPGTYGLGVGGGLVWAASAGSGDLVSIDPGAQRSE